MDVAEHIMNALNGEIGRTVTLTLFTLVALCLLIAWLDRNGPSRSDRKRGNDRNEPCSHHPKR
jgi:hypothetical protein